MARIVSIGTVDQVFAEAPDERWDQMIGDRRRRVPAAWHRLDDFRIAIHNMVESGETVVVEGRLTATVKETGTPVDAQFAHVWEVKNGRVTRFQQYTDTDQWNVAMRSERPASASRA